MAIETLELTLDCENHSIKAFSQTLLCDAWKLPRKLVSTLPSALSGEYASFNICGVYLLVSSEGVYVGEAEHVITRIKQHHARPPFDWSFAIAFTGKGNLFDKADIKCLEHDIYQLLKKISHYDVKNSATPKRSHVRNENSVHKYLENIVCLAECFGFDGLISSTSKEKNSTVSDCKTSDVLTTKVKTDSGFSDEHEKQNSTVFPFKIGRVMLCAFRKALSTGLLKKDIKFLESDEAKKVFKTAGYRVIVSGEKPSKDAGGINRYAKDPVLFNGKQYWITTQSREQGLTALLQFLEQRGMSLSEIKELCQSGKSNLAVHVAENSVRQDVVNKKTKYSLNGGTPLAMSQFVFLFVKEFCNKNPKMTFAELRSVFKDEFVESSFRKPGLLCNMEQIKGIALHNQKKRFEIDNAEKKLISSDGIIFYVNNQWTTQSFQNILKIAEDYGWNVTKIN